jgi:hypothetical protein
MTYLCVHTSHRPITDQINTLRERLIGFGMLIIALAIAGSWFFVGWLIVMKTTCPNQNIETEP